MSRPSKYPKELLERALGRKTYELEIAVKALAGWE